MRATRDTSGLRTAVAIVAGLNLAYFAIEFWVALAIGSVALFADSIDFLEDASVNLLVLIGLGWAAAARRRLGIVLAVLLLVPALATAWTVYEKLTNPSVPPPLPLALTAIGALMVNAGCALLLARVRNAGGSLSVAAFLSARNDAIANIAIIAAGLVTAFYPTIWPDVVVGLAIALLNAGAAWEVYERALSESEIEKTEASRLEP